MRLSDPEGSQAQPSSITYLSDNDLTTTVEYYPNSTGYFELRAQKNPYSLLDTELKTFEAMGVKPR